MDAIKWATNHNNPRPEYAIAFYKNEIYLSSQLFNVDLKDLPTGGVVCIANVFDIFVPLSWLLENQNLDKKAIETLTQTREHLRKLNNEADTTL